VRTEVNPVAHWEVGSEFHWAGLPAEPYFPWPQPAVWFMLARHAVAALIQNTIRKNAADKPTLWLPSYFCPEVADGCRNYSEIREYRDLPTLPEPDWKSLRPQSHDIVLAVNYFGVREAEPWKLWRQKNDCILLEDHSQDPFSGWALSSTADFAFASLRKTLPIADGAILWSPQGRDLPEQPPDGDWTGVVLKLAAMMLKREYLSGAGDAALKAQFRDLQLRGEAMFRTSRISAISPASAGYLANGAPKAWRARRLENGRHLISMLTGVSDPQLLFQKYPDGAVPFAVPILLATEAERDSTQLLLQQQRIYCPVHWMCRTDDPEAIALSRRILGVPVDQRYTSTDMDRIARVIVSNGSDRAVCQGVAV
jgi:hypothetical protein